LIRRWNGLGGKNPRFSVSNSLEQIGAGWRNGKRARPQRIQFCRRASWCSSTRHESYAASMKRLLDTNLMNALAASNCYPVLWCGIRAVQRVWRTSALHPAGRKKPLYVGVPTLRWCWPRTSRAGLRGCRDAVRTVLQRRVHDGTAQRFRAGKNHRRFAHRAVENFESLIREELPDTYHPPQKEGHARSVVNRSIHLTEYVVTLPTKIVSLPLLDGLGSESWTSCCAARARCRADREL